MNLKFWLTMFQKCGGRLMAYHAMKEKRSYNRYVELYNWIEERILNKYGEEND